MNLYNIPFPHSKTYPLTPSAISGQATHPRVSPVFKRCASHLATMKVSGSNRVTYTRDVAISQLHPASGRRSSECDQIGLTDRAGLYIAHSDDGKRIYVGSTSNLRDRIQQHINETSDKVTSREVFGGDVVGLMVVEMSSSAKAKELETFINSMMDYEYLCNKNRVSTKTERANSWDRSYNNQPSAFFLEGQQLTLNSAKQLIFHKRSSVHAIEFRPEAVGVRNLHIQWGWFERLQNAISTLNEKKVRKSLEK